MKTGLSIIAGLVLALGMLGAEARGEDDIRAFVNGKGRVVFTNFADPVPAPRPDRPSAPPAEPVREAHPLDSLIDSISARHGVDSRLVRSVIEIESAFDRRAVSHKGAMGLMQLIPATGRRFGVRDFFDPAQNVEGGVRYLRFLLEKFDGDLNLSLAAYNSGENRVERLGRIPNIRETQDYVRKVRSAYARRGGGIAAPVSVRASAAPEAQAPAGADGGSDPTIYRSVDSRGVVRFSNVAPY